MKKVKIEVEREAVEEVMRVIKEKRIKSPWSNLRLTFKNSSGMLNHVPSFENRLSECLAPCDEPWPKGARPFCG
jgi:hypothetical protein